MRSLYRLLSVRKNLKAYIGLFLTAFLTNIFLIVSPMLQKILLNEIMAGKVLPKDLLLFLLISFAFIAISLIEIYILVQAKIFLQKDITIDLLESLSVLDSPVIRTRGCGAFMSSIFGDAEQISGQLLGNNPFFGIGNILSSIAILIITYRWMRLFPAFILFSYIISLWCIEIVQRKRTYYFDKGREAIYTLNPLMLETLENRKSFMTNATLNARTRMISDRIRERDSSFHKASVLGKLESGCIDSVKQISLVLFFIIAMYQILEKRLDLSSFIAITSYFQTLFLPLYFLKSLSDSKNNIAVLYNRNRFSFDAKPNLRLPRGFEVSVNDVSLRYDENVIYDHINLAIDRVYGIVGLSGDGKSSLFSLLLGDEKPSSGTVLIGNQDVSSYDLHMRLNLFKFYPQENEIFDADLNYNLTLGKMPLSLKQFEEEQENIYIALKQVRRGRKISSDSACQSIINTFKVSRNQDDVCFFKYELQARLQELNETDLFQLAQLIVTHNYYVREDYDRLIAEFDLEHLQGRSFGQRGNKISGGEKNKICLARMLLIRDGASFLIDEPFTSLDLINESKNVDVLKTYLSGKKGLIISHKIDLLKKLTDQILVIHQGSVEAVGTHAQLLESSPTYQKLHAEYLKKNQEYVSSPDPCGQR